MPPAHFRVPRQLPFAPRPILSGLRFFNESEISDSGSSAWSPSRRTRAQDFYVLKKSIDLSRVWTCKPWISMRARYPEITEALLVIGGFKFVLDSNASSNLMRTPIWKTIFGLKRCSLYLCKYGISSNLVQPTWPKAFCQIMKHKQIPSSTSNTLSDIILVNPIISPVL